MPDETVISDLVAQAEALRDGGTEPDLAALAAAPHLLPEVRDRLARLAAVGAVLAPPRPGRPRPSTRWPPATGTASSARSAGGTWASFTRPATGTRRAVALKTVNRPDPTRLAYLKRDFDALADVRHENLVACYGLCRTGTPGSP